MEKRNIWIFGITGVLVVCAIIASLSFRPSAGNLETQSAAPAGAIAPDEGSTNAPANVAVPAVQVPAAPGTTASFRSYNVGIKNDAYSPDTFVVNQGDTVNFWITAVDGNYGFTQPDYGLNVIIKKGVTKQVQFQALQPGKFMFYCGSCGGPAKGPVGNFIVTSK